MDHLFAPLGAAEEAWVCDQLVLADEFALQYAPGASGSENKLATLDRAFAAYLAAGAGPDAANAVVLAVGVALGARLVAEFGFRWGIVTDAWGTDLAVQALPGRGDVTICPTEFVAKRYERREAPFLAEALLEIGECLGDVASEWIDLP